MALTPKDLETLYHFTYSDVLVFESPCLKETIRKILQETPLTDFSVDTSISKAYLEYLSTPPLFDYEIIQISEHVGHGVFTKEPLSGGHYLGEYTGLLTTEPTYLSMNGYLFHYPIEHLLGSRISIDAKNTGNLTRFYNHSFSPNTDKHLVFDGEYLHWIFLANRSIQVGEQITYDYGKGYWYLWGAPEHF